MIYVKLMGGLGNQMFQYAAARQLAMIHQSPFKLDLSGFHHQKKRSYALSSFRIQESIASLGEVDRIRYRSTSTIARLFYKGLQKLHLWNCPGEIRENWIGPYNSGIQRVAPPIILEGYWQSEKYFEQVTQQIHNEFSLREQPGSISQSVAEQIRGCSAVSLHIRRGDYVKESQTKKVHGVCGLDYYMRAISVLKAKLADPHFFVFSDDPDWVRNNLKLSDPMVVLEHNGEQAPHEDLWLMSLCQHHIIANSSFSWWGAWLGKNNQKIVCAPQKWFQADYIDTRDLLPSSWIRVLNN